MPRVADPHRATELEDLTARRARINHWWPKQSRTAFKGVFGHGGNTRDSCALHSRESFNQSNTSPLALHAPGGPSFVLLLACYWETLKNLVRYL